MSQPATPRALFPVVLGLALTVVFLAAIGYIAHQRKSDQRSAPQLLILAPSEGSIVDSPLVVRFRSAEPLTLGPSGWATRDLHLHARVNGIEHMPGASDMRHTGSLTYQWLMTAAPRGAVRLQLGWADRAHRELSSGGSDLHSFTVR